MSRKTTIRIGPRPAAKHGGLDPRGADAVLVHVGRKHGEFPARDLSGADLNRAAYRRALFADSTTRPPDLASSDVLEAIADELVEGGFYSRDVPRETEPTPEPPEPAEPPTPDVEPVTPAEEPEVRS